MTSNMIRLGIFVAVVAVAIVFVNAVFLDEKPAFLNPCKQTDPNFNRCLAKNIEALFREWKDGIPGLKSIPSIDPYHVNRISVVQDNDNAFVQLHIDLSNIELGGLSKLKIEEASFDPDKLVTKLKVFAPKFHIDAQYALKGRIVNLALNGNGVSTIDAENCIIDIAMRLKRRNEHDFVFTDVDKVRLEISEIGGLHIQLDNLFNGEKELEDSANALINDNWRALEKVLRPAVANVIQKVMLSHFKKIFAYVPASYFIEDV